MSATTRSNKEQDIESKLQQKLDLIDASLQQQQAKFQQLEDLIEKSLASFTASIDKHLEDLHHKYNHHATNIAQLETQISTLETSNQDIKQILDIHTSEIQTKCDSTTVQLYIQESATEEAIQNAKKFVIATTEVSTITILKSMATVDNHTLQIQDAYEAITEHASHLKSLDGMKPMVDH